MDKEIVMRVDRIRDSLDRVTRMLMALTCAVMLFHKDDGVVSMCKRLMEQLESELEARR